MTSLWIEKYPESVQQIIRVLALHGPLKASEIARITGFHKQTIYKGLAVLSKDDLLKVKEDGTNKYSLSEEADSNQILSHFETEDKYGILTMNGEPLNSIHIQEEFRATFIEFGYLPAEKIYGCKIYLDSLTKSTIASIRTFADNLRKLHYRLESVYWTIDGYSRSDGTDFGVGVESLIRTIAQDGRKRKTVVAVTFVVQDWFGGYFGLIYNIQARWTNLDRNNGVIDQTKLHIILDKIPIGKEFAISWSQQGQLPFVEEYVSIPEKLLDGEIRLSEKHILGVVNRFGHEIVFPINPTRGLPSRLLARVHPPYVALEDLTAGRPVHIRVSRYSINPRHGVDRLFDSASIRPGHSEVELVCAVISESNA